MSTTQLHWYMLGNDGMATLCANQADAEEESRTSNQIWPGRGYRAAQLVDAARIAELEARGQELGKIASDCNSRKVIELEAMLAVVGAGGVQQLIASKPPVTLINEGDMTGQPAPEVSHPSQQSVDALDVNRSEALHAAVSAIYFDDSSKFKSALGRVVYALDHKLAGGLLCDPKAAFEKSQAWLDAAIAAQKGKP